MEELPQFEGLGVPLGHGVEDMLKAGLEERDPMFEQEGLHDDPREGLGLQCRGHSLNTLVFGGKETPERNLLALGVFGPARLQEGEFVLAEGLAGVIVRIHVRVVRVGVRGRQRPGSPQSF